MYNILKLFTIFSLIMGSDVFAEIKLVDNQVVSAAMAENLYEKGKLNEAFDMHLLLATSGDDRSQFNLGHSYYEGIKGFIEPDMVEAYAWMKVSIKEKESMVRSRNLNSVSKMLTEIQLEKANALADKYYEMYGSGKRFNNPLNMADLLANVKGLGCPKVGTHIMNKCPAKYLDPKRSWKNIDAAILVD